MHLTHVVLILPHTNRLRIDFDQLGQRVLQAARDRDSTTQRNIKIGEFTRSQLRGRVNRRARLADDDLGKPRISHQLQQVGGQTVSFTRSRTVTDRNQTDIVLFDQQSQLVQRTIPVIAWGVRIDGVSGEQFAGRVHNRNFDPSTQSGIKSEDGATSGRRRKQ